MDGGTTMRGACGAIAGLGVRDRVQHSAETAPWRDRVAGRIAATRRSLSIYRDCETFDLAVPGSIWQ